MKRINVDVSDDMYDKLKELGHKLGGLPTTSVTRFLLKKGISVYTDERDSEETLQGLAQIDK